jgi:hypothetical protein
MKRGEKSNHMKSILEAAIVIQDFEKGSLTKQISAIEKRLAGADISLVQSVYPSLSVTTDLLESAIMIKRASSQINVLIHSIGILLSLPGILDKDESVEYLSLGAGTGGKPFDLETNHRVAEFKFTNWQGGSETIRKNSLFKDFFLLAEYETDKQKYLYVLGKEHPVNFLNGGRSLENVMSRNVRLWSTFQMKYGDRFKKVCEYFEYRKSEVQLVDVSEIIPQFRNVQIRENND